MHALLNPIYIDVEHLFNRRSMVAVKGRNISVQTSFKLKLPPPLIIEASSIKIVESIGEGKCWRVCAAM